MGWAVGFVGGRWIGYGVPAICDQPECGEEIDRGLSYACGGGVTSTLDDEQHCGNFFCMKHLTYWRDDSDPNGSGANVCDACYEGRPPYEPKPDALEWVRHMLTDESWEKWRDESPREVAEGWRRIAAEGEREARRRLGRAWGAWLELAMETRLAGDDERGPSLLEWALMEDPTLARRLKRALEQHKERTEDESTGDRLERLV